jgi:hypothetical protein
VSNALYEQELSLARQSQALYDLAASFDAAAASKALDASAAGAGGRRRHGGESGHPAAAARRPGGPAGVAGGLQQRDGGHPRRRDPGQPVDQHGGGVMGHKAGDIREDGFIWHNRCWRNPVTVAAYKARACKAQAARAREARRNHTNFEVRLEDGWIFWDGRFVPPERLQALMAKRATTSAAHRQLTIEDGRNAEYCRGWAMRNPDRMASYASAWKRSLSGRAYRLLAAAAKRAEATDREITIDRRFIEERLEAGICEVTGERFDFDPPVGGTHRNPWAPSVDRRDNNGGYTPENTQIVCVAYNISKADWSSADHRRLVEAMARAYGLIEDRRTPFVAAA